MNALEMALEALTNPSVIAVQHAIELIRAELAKPEQEPYFCKDCGKGLLGEGHIHTCSPQVKRQWVGLTDDECIKLIDEIRIYSGDYEALIARTIEAKLKELNK